MLDLVVVHFPVNASKCDNDLGIGCLLADVVGIETDSISDLVRVLEKKRSYTVSIQSKNMF